MPQKKTKIVSKLQTRSMAQLDKEIKKILEDQHEDRPIENLFSSGEWAGSSPPHLIHGKPYENTKKHGRT
jgi:hypothetical protein